MTQWLRLYSSTAWGTGSIPGWGTKIPYAMCHGKKKQNQKNYKTLMEKIREQNNRQYFMFMDKKIQYYQTVDSSQPDLQIQRNPNQNPSKVLCGYWHIYSKVHMRSKRSKPANTILKEKKLEGWCYSISVFSIKLQ